MSKHHRGRTASASAFLEVYIGANPDDENRNVETEKQNMSKTAVPGAPGNVHNGIRLSTTAEGGSLLEGLQAAYQSLDPEERQEIKAFMSDLAEEQGRLTMQKREQ